MSQWFNVELSIEQEAALAIARQQLRNLQSDELINRASGWLGDLLNQQIMLNCYAKRVMQLEIEAAINNGTTDNHMRWAQDAIKDLMLTAANPADDFGAASSGVVEG